ncbi:MAG: YgjV family protein [Niastella sp.]|nr:YgjV family protein [Niastella sp.]
MLQQIAPWLGYLASLSLIIALLVKTEQNFRWFNIIGNICFITYALVLNAIPVFLTNIILLFINSYYLYKLFTLQEDFDLIEFKGEEKLVDKFLHFYQHDIQNYFPEFKKRQIEAGLNFVILRNLVIANIFSARLHPNGDAEVNINYTLAKYRDYKIGTFIFEKERDLLISKGVKRIIYTNPTHKKHQHFLKVMGFTVKPGENGKVYIKNL